MANLLEDKQISLFELDVKDLKRQKKSILARARDERNRQLEIKRRKDHELQRTQKVTNEKLDKRTRDIMKILEKKNQVSKKDYRVKEKILRKGFGEVVKVLIRNVRI